MHPQTISPCTFPVPATLPFPSQDRFQELASHASSCFSNPQQQPISIRMPSDRGTRKHKPHTTTCFKDEARICFFRQRRQKYIMHQCTCSKHLSGAGQIVPFILINAIFISALVFMRFVAHHSRERGSQLRSACWACEVQVETELQAYSPLLERRDELVCVVVCMH